MVRLKVRRSSETPHVKTGFNSLMVRLKATAGSGGTATNGLFQFPNGSIKRLKPLFARITQRKFQFPNGSIKSRSGKTLRYQIICFNSLMVRLKGATNSLLDNFTAQFQFPNGSIKSQRMPRSSKNQKCFNSLMVRLKETVILKVLGDIDSFNSLMVRLKVPTRKQ